MNCLWCRGTVHQRAGFNSPDFCCKRCEHRFYDTGHLLEEDRLRDRNMRAEREHLTALSAEWAERCENNRRVLADIERKREEAAEELNAATGYLLFSGLVFASTVACWFGWWMAAR